MAEWTDGSERICTGSCITFGQNPRDVVQVFETPTLVRELMDSAGNDLLELRHIGNHEIAAFVDRRHIVAIVPIWGRVDHA